MFARRATLSGHAKKPHSLVTAANGAVLVSTSDDLSIRIWDPATWSIRHVISDMDPDTRQAISVLDVSACGNYLATAMADFTTKVYSTLTGERIARLHPVKRDFYNAAEQIRFPLVGDYLACAKGRMIEYFRIGDFAKLGELRGHTSKAHLLAISPDGRTLISCGGKYVKLWDMTTFTERATLTRHTKLLGSLEVAANGNFFATGGEDNQIYLWSLPDGQEIGAYKHHTNYVFDLAISPDGQTIASWDMSRTLHVWHVATGTTIARLENVWGRSRFLPHDNLLIFCGELAGTLIIDPTNGEIVQRLPASGDVAVAPDGSWFASIDGNDIAIWSKSEAT